ncbi:hypothetical protein [Streptomyces microflavus]|uniref:Uncharacterized protein n=1 Tax=Streptomyces microflavus TaxID=1919 RepID=A0A6N9V7V9_STRMI|nr:hypothetical protein [Streptomyces microflavus]NEB66181.1 hypothetical protein [Streptomyces microflavus]
MHDRQPPPYQPWTPGAPWAYAPPQAREFSVGYRRWVGIPGVVMTRRVRSSSRTH